MEHLPVAPLTIDEQRAHQAAIAANFQEAAQPLLADEHEQVRLRHQQPRVLGDLVTFMADTQDELGRAIIIPPPPNFGKSFMSILCMDLAGVGRVVPETGQPLRGLFVTPRRVGLRQALPTFKWLTPTLDVMRFDGTADPETFDEADVVALTYKAVLSMREETWERLTSRRDFWALDEIHRGIGSQTAARLIPAREKNNPTVLVASATPRFNDQHNVANALDIDRSTCHFTEREAIRLGAANEAHLFALYSGEEIQFSSKRSSITEADVQPLMFRRDRNKLILDTMVDMAASGRSGIVQLIPGDKSRHARNIAAWASTRKFVDPSTGKRRHMVVKALGNFQTETENNQIIEDFRAGKIDALTFTKYITETFDCPLGYVYGACPLGSEVEARQLTGRGGRYNSIPTVFLSLFDKYVARSRKRVWTFFDVFGEDQVYQGKRLGKIRRADDDSPPTKDQSSSDSHRGRKDEHDSAIPPLYFSKSVHAAMDRIPPGTVLDELLLMQGTLEEVPDDYIHIDDLPVVREGLATPEGARFMLAEKVADDGRPLFRSIEGNGRFRQFVLGKQAETIVRSRSFDSRNNVTRLEITAFLESQGWPRLSFEGFCTVCDEAGVVYTVVKKGLHLKAAEAEKTLLRLLDTPFVDPETELAISHIARAVEGKASTTDYFRFLKKRPDFYEQFLRTRRLGIPPATYRQVKALSLEGAYHLLEDAVKEGGKIGRMVGSIAAIDMIISQAQDYMRTSYKERNMKPCLSREAIELFMAPYKPDYVPPPPPLPPAPPPLDASYALSSYGLEWMDHASCGDEDPDLFFPTASPTTSKGRQQIEDAKAVCRGCPVKGDCLQHSFKVRIETVAGGFTPDERRGINSEARTWLKQSASRPKNLS